jgi:hypothetical protein
LLRSLDWTLVAEYMGRKQQPLVVELDFDGHFFVRIIVANPDFVKFCEKRIGSPKSAVTVQAASSRQRDYKNVLG